MEKLTLLFRLLPYLAFLYGGTFAILEVLFPSLRDPDFNRWEVDDASGTTVQVLGWKKIITPPRVLAQGYVSDSTACVLAIAVGVIFISVGTFGVRHVSGFPGFLPDLFGRL